MTTTTKGAATVATAEDHDDAGATTTDDRDDADTSTDWPPAPPALDDDEPRVGYPAGLKRGVCRVGGDHDAETPNSTYCAEHKPVRPDRKPRARRPRDRSREPSRRLETELRTNLELAGQLFALRDPVCGQVMIAEAPKIAKYWAEQARRSPRVARALDGIVSTGGWLGAISVHAPLAMTVFAHHVAPVLAARHEPDEGDAELVDEPAPWPPMAQRVPMGPPGYGDDGADIN